MNGAVCFRYGQICDVLVVLAARWTSYMDVILLPAFSTVEVDFVVNVEVWRCKSWYLARVHFLFCKLAEKNKVHGLCNII